MGSAEKNRVIVASVLAGRSMGQTARQYGVSKVWVHKLVKRYRQGGWDALEPGSRRPHKPANTTSKATTEQIIALRPRLLADGLDAGAATIREHLLRDHGTAPAVSTIWRILKRAGMVTPQPRERPRHTYLRFEADLPNECWQADFTHWGLDQGSDTNILIWLDDQSRFLISATAHTVVTTPIVLDTFTQACAEHGIPAATLTDNGFVFTTRSPRGPNAFETRLAHLGIQQRNESPNHPQTQGKVERESHWVWWRLGLLDFDQGLIGPFRSVERVFELRGRYVTEVAVQALVVVPVDPAQDGELDIVDGLPGPSLSCGRRAERSTSRRRGLSSAVCGCRAHLEGDQPGQRLDRDAPTALEPRCRTQPQPPPSRPPRCGSGRCSLATAASTSPSSASSPDARPGSPNTTPPGPRLRAQLARHPQPR